ncbi:hypothetical protein LPB87_02900 [Flavobacterium sp. EDS]|uniref:hypothetical protein n=1 Tax=Flavobacterium sp. EDS TaxID=2897328 RepID=UPI001E5FFCC1|nr:hypothetical protein [Flavobacterium sp. EDS]MCD0473336.1 hypothetical protein [Flavobacterium sp. EDS]
MELITKMTGAVFFVDILGFGALTQNQIELNDKDFAPWLDQYGQHYDNQILAAAILAEFREILMDLDKIFSVTISQLSDCAFVWSENIKDVILVANNIMSRCIDSGILCRGGLSYGEIIETNQNHSLGRFILGKAVTEAVKLEGIAKGCRIMITQEFPKHLYHKDKKFSQRIYPLFQPFINPLDYITYDEFKWYCVPNMTKDVTELSIISTEEKNRLTYERLMLAVKVRVHPKFSWNSKNQGLIQIKASINFLSSSNDAPFNIEHNFNWGDIIEDRNIKSIHSFESHLIKEIIKGESSM